METATAAPVVEPSAIAIALAEHQTRARPLGEGEFPAELSRFCWGAFFFPWLWALRRGVWWILLVWLATLVPVPLTRTLVPSFYYSPYFWIPYALIVAALTVFFVWLGVNGNRLAWRASAKSKVARNGMTVGKLLDGETTWILFGIGFELLTIGAAAWGLRTHSLEAADAASVVIEMAGLATAVYLSRHVDGPLWCVFDSRRERPTKAST